MIAGDDDLSLIIPLERRSRAVLHRNGGPRQRAKPHRDHADPLLFRHAGFRFHLFHRLKRLAVTHHHQGAVRTAGRELEELHSLFDRVGQRRAHLPNGRGIEVVEEQIQRTDIDRQWREYIAAAGEGEQPYAVARRGIEQPPDLLLHPLQPIGVFIGCHHR